MLGWFQALMPKEGRFFDYFEQHSQISLAGAKTLRDLLEGGDKVPTQCEEIYRLEDSADAVAAEVGHALRRSFITPFDRGDIDGLINDMDDAIDQMKQTAKAISLFDVVSFEPCMVKIGDRIVEAARIVSEAMPLLRALNANAVKLNAAGAKIVQIEEEADQLYLQGLKDLYRKHKDDHPMGYIVGSEIYGHLEKVVDYFEDVAKRINGILLEHL